MAVPGRFELRLARRDGRGLRHPVEPVVEHFVVDRDHELQEVVGRHFIPMAAAAERVRIQPWTKVRELPWLHEYQLEVWDPRDPRRPQAVSTSTRGWRD